MDALNIPSLLALCAPLVHPATAQALVSVESAGNPYAIGVVGGRLDRQPRNLGEALVTVRRLAADRWNFSIGLAQINRHNLGRLGLTLRSGFEPCQNLRAMQSILVACLERAVPARRAPEPVHQALSCYYSGNSTIGFQHGYVQRVLGMATTVARRSPALQAIATPARTTQTPH